MAISFFPKEISDRNLSHFLFWSQFHLFCDQVKLKHQLPFSFPLQTEASVTLDWQWQLILNAQGSTKKKIPRTAQVLGLVPMVSTK